MLFVANRKIKLFFPNSMRQALMLLVLVVLVPIVLVQTIIYYDQFNARLADEYRANLEFARIVALGFEGFIQDVLHQELAVGKGLQLLKPFREKQAQFLHDQQAKYLEENANAYRSVRLFLWADPNGVITLASDSSMIGLNIHSRDYFQKIVKGSEWEVSDLLKPLTGDNLIFVIARGIRDERGRLEGVVIAIIDPEKMGEHPFAVKRFEQGSTLIFDRNGLAVYRFPEVTLTLYLRQKLGSRSPNLTLALKGQEGTTTIISPIDGIKKISAAAPIASIGWSAEANRPEAAALKHVFMSIRYNLVLVIMVACISFLIALFIARRVTYQTALIRDYALAIGKSQASPGIEKVMIAELKEVSHALTHMAEELKERTLAVERVADEAKRRADELDAIFNAMEQGVMIYNEKGQIVNTNAKVRESLGFDPVMTDTKMTYEDRLKLRSPSGEPLMTEQLPFRRALQGKRVVGQQIVFTNAKGQEQVSLVSSTPLYKGDQIRGAVDCLAGCDRTGNACFMI